ncbi:MAG TPA: glucose-6-phosphate dehydrogenase assembly protein OpcA [Dehalococcoidia bacterium]|nr:glucose-6-phosphate dehydrogenase assembly protein OpcA [Dehalococcoidia bacterium]
MATTTEVLQELAGWNESPTNVDAIQAALLRIWREANNPHPQNDGRSGFSGGIVRTRVANLLVYASTHDGAQRSAAILRELALRHPVRSLLLTHSSTTASDALGAAVHAFCRPSAGRSVCFEQIQLTAGDSAARHLASVAGQLLVHDLPTLLWWPGSPPFGSPLFRRLADLADLLAFDSSEFAVAADGLIALGDGARPLRGQKAVADLNWNRLADWRELIAQFFDHDEARLALEQVTSVEIEVAGAGGSAASAQVLLLAGWLGSRLHWRLASARQSSGAIHLRMRRGRAAVEVRLTPSSSKSARPGSICAVRIYAGTDGAAQRFCLESEPDEPHATATAERASGGSNCRCFVLQERSEAELLAEELETLGREHALDDALDFAGQIAARLLQGPAGDRD